ncbi:unnamed protein product [Chironomus riparius]|uniref:Uncharacterized protein n=1 Tax=Chironomus riparius TaxID=315576 RepID=A0A9N9S6I8_9DIPT|nr:unnamed protein product [Chironomus riparius]
MNIVQLLLIFVIFSTNLISICGFCVPQERNHVLLHDGDQLNDEIYNFSIQTRKSDNCDQLLWIKFFIEWKWKNNEENFDLLSQEMKVFQAAFSSYFNSLFQKFKNNPIELILKSFDVNMFNNVEKPEEFTEIKTLFKCKSTLPIVSKFLEQDCDDLMKTLLKNFRVKQFFLYFQEESVSSEIYYAQIPQAQQTRILQDQLEEIYDDVNNDDTIDHLTKDFYIKNVVPLKNGDFYIVAEILFPFIDPKTLSDRKSKNYQKLLKDFAEYSEKLYAANPLALNSNIKCKVDEIIDSFEKIGNHFIAIPNAFIVNFCLQIIGFKIDHENVKLLDGNVFDKIFENFKSEELFKAYEKDEEYFVDRNGFIFDNFIESNERKVGFLNGDYEDFVDDQEEVFENQHSSSNRIDIKLSDESNSSHQPIVTKIVIEPYISPEYHQNHVKPSPKDNITQNNNEPIIEIQGTKLKITNFSDSFTCENCKILIYANLSMKVLEINNESNSREEEEEEEEDIDYKNYDYSSLEKLNNDISLAHEIDESKGFKHSNENSQKFNKDNIQDFLEQIGFSDESIESIESIEEVDMNETKNIFKIFDPNDPMWKNIIETSNIDNNEEQAGSRYTNDLSTEDYSEQFSVQFSSEHDTIETYSSKLNHQSSTSDKISLVETLDLNKNDETLPSTDNYVMINNSNSLKSQIMLTAIFAFLVNNF